MERKLTWAVGAKTPSRAKLFLQGGDSLLGPFTISERKSEAVLPSPQRKTFLSQLFWRRERDSSFIFLLPSPASHFLPAIALRAGEAHRSFVARPTGGEIRVGACQKHNEKGGGRRSAERGQHGEEEVEEEGIAIPSLSLVLDTCRIHLGAPSSSCTDSPLGGMARRGGNVSGARFETCCFFLLSVRTVSYFV